MLEGSLVLIRPDDIHYYENGGTAECRLLNLAFPKTTLEALLDYLGEGFKGERLLDGETPPGSIVDKEVYPFSIYQMINGAFCIQKFSKKS